MWPQNTKVVGQRKPNNMAALKLLEEGYVIVQEHDIPADIVPFGRKPIPEPYNLKLPEPGDVTVLLDGHHKSYAHMIEDAPNDGNAYVRKSGKWVLLSIELGAGVKR